MSHHGCSLPLQRVVTDLGADLPFAQAAGKLYEHYGVTLSPSAIRQVTEGHARALLAGSDDEPAWPTQTRSRDRGCGTRRWPGPTGRGRPG